MPARLGRQATAARMASWIVAAAALLLAVVVAVVAVRAGNGGSRVAGGPHSDMMMSRGMTADDEGGYLAEMVAHHEEAVEAATELSRSGRREVRELGRAIVTSQTAQIVQMRAWLEQWHDDAGRASYAPMMRDLSQLSGDDLDRTFLEDMVMHHRMAVMMSRHLLSGTAELHPGVANLANDIVREQMAEIRLMTGWLADWFGITAGMGSGMMMSHHRSPGAGMGQSSRTRSPRRGTTAQSPRSSSIRRARAAEPAASP